MAQGNGTLHRSGRQALASHGEVQVHFGEHLGLFIGTFGAELDAAAAHVVAPTAQDEHHVVGGAATGARQQGLHRAWSQVAPAQCRLRFIGGAVHGQDVAAAGFGNEAHAGLGTAGTRPTYCAFHESHTFLKGSMKKECARLQQKPGPCRLGGYEMLRCSIVALQSHPCTGLTGAPLVSSTSSQVDSAPSLMARGFFLRQCLAGGWAYDRALALRPPRLLPDCPP